MLGFQLEFLQLPAELGHPALLSAPACPVQVDPAPLEQEQEFPGMGSRSTSHQVPRQARDPPAALGRGRAGLRCARGCQEGPSTFLSQHPPRPVPKFTWSCPQTLRHHPEELCLPLSPGAQPGRCCSLRHGDTAGVSFSPSRGPAGCGGLALQTHPSFSRSRRRAGCSAAFTGAQPWIGCLRTRIELHAAK